MVLVTHITLNADQDNYHDHSIKLIILLIIIEHVIIFVEEKHVNYPWNDNLRFLHKNVSQKHAYKVRPSMSVRLEVIRDFHIDSISKIIKRRHFRSEFKAVIRVAPEVKC